MESPIPHKTAEPTEYPTPTDTPIESQHLYDINPDKYNHIVLEADETLFGIKIEGSVLRDNIPGWEIVYNDNEDQTFKRETYTPANLNIDKYFTPDQIDGLKEKYGGPINNIVFEIDLKESKVGWQINGKIYTHDHVEGYDSVYGYL